MLAVLVEERPKVVSFHFGLPSRERIEALHAAGIVLLATATSLEEGPRRRLRGGRCRRGAGLRGGRASRGIRPRPAGRSTGDAGADSAVRDRPGDPRDRGRGDHGRGGDRGVPHARRRRRPARHGIHRVPGVVGRRGVPGRLARPGAWHTVMTSAISGRPARCLANRFTALGDAVDVRSIPDYPIAYDAGKALHAAARAAGEFGYGAQWAGQGARSDPVAPCLDAGRRTPVRDGAGAAPARCAGVVKPSRHPKAAVVSVAVCN